MEALQHFDRIDEKGYTIYKLKEKEWDDFINKLTDDFRLSYISDNLLNKRASKRGITASEFLEKYIVPDDGKIKSGDFGEMLSFYIVIENYLKKGITVLGPKKWKWKDRNKAAQYTDSILFGIHNPKKFTTSDLLVSIESKMKATKSSAHRIQDAVDGAVDDKLSRLAKSLIWLEEKYAQLGKNDPRIRVERFKDPATYGSYIKEHKAIAILDKDFETEETAKTINNKENIKIIVFSINELQKAYEQTRTNIINSV